MTYAVQRRAYMVDTTCDICGRVLELVEGDTVAEVKQCARDLGWTLRDDDGARCPYCFRKKQPRRVEAKGVGNDE